MPMPREALTELAYTELRRGIAEPLVENAYPCFRQAAAYLRELLGDKRANEIYAQVLEEFEDRPQHVLGRTYAKDSSCTN